ncbi:hypothetical protein SanaruYs_29320 [Chryseotalea sanaruensis]|uniref:Uncharacterized protein n=1 Tax=Chryseotalea sanaruensis TaxID=2482724 RepID=A0A401UCT6_9BACT|nr:hypothetical protein [Chryseotalea sanaruensis]GCC52694.1 hypothetical protein SanaruYs_29320 [Chryseotalea sanaruensis]
MGVQIEFTVTDDSTLMAYRSYLENHLLADFDKIFFYGNHEHLQEKNHLDGLIVISEDGLFYDTKEYLVGTKEITLDDLTKYIKSKSREELMSMGEPTKEKGMQVSDMRDVLIRLKNDHIRKGGDNLNTWIYIEYVTSLSLNDIIDILVLLKYLNIQIKSYQGKYYPHK